MSAARAAATWLLGAALAGGALASGLLLTRRAVPEAVGADSPALSALFVALGGARGVLSEILWWRIGDLQRQGRFAELVPLTDLLVTLDPASPDAWAYNAWNLAYNVSAAHYEPAERWRWVRRGLALLERGLRADPASEVILRQIGWIWEDKIGGPNDDAAPYYRRQAGTLPPPEGAEAFAGRLGGGADWGDPRVRALFWYDRARHPRDVLRATLTLLRGAPPQTLRARQAYLLAAARAAWPELAPSQAAQLRAFVQGLAEASPGDPALRAFLQETAP